VINELIGVYEWNDSDEGNYGFFRGKKPVLLPLGSTQILTRVSTVRGQGPTV